MQEHALSVSRTARYFTIDPIDTLCEVWFVLHGYGELASYFLMPFEAIDDGTRLIVAPEALSRFYLKDHERVGGSWMTREDRLNEIQDYLAYLDAVAARVLDGVDTDRVGVHVLGFSQGAATASRWATLGEVPADRLILWGGGLAHDLDLDVHADRLRRLDLTFVAGDDDTWLTPERVAAQESILEQHDIPYRRVPFDGGHRLDSDVLRAVADEA